MVDIALGLKFGWYKQCQFCKTKLTERKQRIVGYCPNCAKKQIDNIGEIAKGLLKIDNQKEMSIFQGSPKALQKLIIKRTAKLVKTKPLNIQEEMIQDDINKFKLTESQITYYRKCMK